MRKPAARTIAVAARNAAWYTWMNAPATLSPGTDASAHSRSAAAQIAATSACRYVAGGEEPPPPIVANAFAYPFLIIHVIAAVTALVVAPVQFVALVRRRWPAFHRFAGRLYLLPCAVGAPAGFVLALGTTLGPVAGSGFAVLALLSAGFTWLGWRSAVERRFEAHREWMLRSYAMTAAAITLRLMIPASAWAGLDFVASYQVIAWLSWTTNLALAEFYIRRGRPRSANSGRLVEA
jgi:uncharacterized membrane protein